MASTDPQHIEQTNDDLAECLRAHAIAVSLNDALEKRCVDLSIALETLLSRAKLGGQSIGEDPSFSQACSEAQSVLDDSGLESAYRIRGWFIGELPSTADCVPTTAVGLVTTNPREANFYSAFKKSVTPIWLNRPEHCHSEALRVRPFTTLHEHQTIA